MLRPGIKIRTIQQEDNVPLARIIRDTLLEFKANRPGTVYYDKTTDHLFELFQQPRSVYFVSVLDEAIVGGGGIFPSDGLPDGTCELVKMYLLPEARGIGLGKKIIEECLNFAKINGYEQVYIESMPELEKALKVYAQFGFKYISSQLGNTGHHGCEKWMLLKI
ncbi:MAG: GNAT family N-acetyltransferase [Chitinophagaceae bacterium]|jgi:putative acetyltransferase|nr:GNAT family N-acetyltransferase [Chitinophagaceae bacterium]